MASQEPRSLSRTRPLLVFLAVAGAVIVVAIQAIRPKPAASVVTAPPVPTAIVPTVPRVSVLPDPIDAPVTAAKPALIPMEPVAETQSQAAAVVSPGGDGASESENLRQAQASVPILMYHYVGELPPNPNAIRRDLTVSPANFEAQLVYLRDHGYHSISLRQLYEHLSAGQPLPSRPIVLTFDDGHKDNYENAYPLLLRYGFTGTFFIVSDFADQAPWEYMTWDQLREMHAHRMEIEDHTRSHADLRNRKPAFLRDQVLTCRDAIETQIGERPHFFAYPGGKYDQAVIDVLRAEGFWGAATTMQGIRHSADRLFQLKRVRVRGTFTGADLGRALDYFYANG